MQYPIIDNLIYAYLKNGWTGLNIENVYSILSQNARPVTAYNIPFNITGYGVSGTGIPSWGSSGRFRILYFSDENYNLIIDNNIQIKIFTDTPGITITSQFINVDKSITIEAQLPVTSEIITVDFYIMLYIGNEPTNYSYNVYDLANRLKLPLPHYFPHSVIDALISAADGQHTEEEKQILRHYLTPLGIGGI